MNASLKDRVIVVTGSGRGLGCACAQRLANEGAAICVAEIEPLSGEQTAEQLLRSGAKAMFVQTDVASMESTERLANAILDKWGRIDGLVTNAALANSVGGATYDQITIDDWDRIMRVNVRGTWLTCRAIAPHMQKQKHGSIVTISSDTAHWGSPKLLHYVSSKGAVEAFTRSLARELGPDGIRVNCVAPGLLDNDATAGVPLTKRQWNIANRAIPREGGVSDIAGLVSFLLSDDASFITGQVILANGGLVLI